MGRFVEDALEAEAAFVVGMTTVSTRTAFTEPLAVRGPVCATQMLASTTFFQNPDDRHALSACRASTVGAVNVL